MSITTRAFAAILVSLLSSSVLAVDPLVAGQENSARSHVIVLAHRACWGEAPEVSIAAISHCKEIGADMAEIDVRESSDGVLVLMHDETVDRTTNGSGLVSAMTAADLRALRLKAGAGGPNATLTSQHVPTLEEGMAAVRENNLLVNLHLKAPVDVKVADIVKRMGMTDRVTTWVLGKPDDPKLLTSPLRGAMGLIPTMNECGPKYPEPCWSTPIRSLEEYTPLKPTALFLDFRQSRTFIQAVSEAARPTGTRIFVETLGPVDQLSVEDRHAEWKWMLDHGVSMIMTDKPGDLIEFLNATPRKSAR